MKEKKQFQNLNDNDIIEVMERQRWLEENTDSEYDAYVKKQFISDWWKENLWQHLSFELEE